MNTKDQMFRRCICALLSVLVIVTSAPAAFAQSSNGKGKTTLVSALSLVKEADLNFGDLIAGNAAGSVVVSPASVRQVSGGTVASGGTVSAALFQGQGTGGQRIRVRAPSGNYTLTHSLGLATMTLHTMTVDVDNATFLNRGNSGQYRINNTGPFFVRVGGTLDVGANQLSGTYTGTFEVDVDYF